MFQLQPHLAVTVGIDILPTHFGDSWQQNVLVEGGLLYSLGQHDGGGMHGGPMTVSLENPFTSALIRDEADYRKKKTAYDEATKEIQTTDAAWMKKNLTPQGQKVVQSYKDDEVKAKEAFDKAADALDSALADDSKLQTQASSDAVDKARQGVKDADEAVKAAHAGRIRAIWRGFTDQASKHYSKIDDDYNAAKNKYDDTKTDFDKWNKEHGIK